MEVGLPSDHEPLLEDGGASAPRQGSKRLLLFAAMAAAAAAAVLVLLAGARPETFSLRANAAAQLDAVTGNQTADETAAPTDAPAEDATAAPMDAPAENTTAADAPAEAAQGANESEAAEAAHETQAGEIAWDRSELLPVYEGPSLGVWRTGEEGDVETLDAAKQRCENNSDCVGFAWKNDDEGHQCWPKGAINGSYEWRTDKRASYASFHFMPHRAGGGAPYLDKVSHIAEAPEADGVVVEACPPPAEEFNLPQKGCPVQHYVTCCAQNQDYATFAEAWAACGTVPDCGAIMRWTSGRYYLRRRGDPDGVVEGAASMLYSCGEAEEPTDAPAEAAADAGADAGAEGARQILFINYCPQSVVVKYSQGGPSETVHNQSLATLLTGSDYMFDIEKQQEKEGWVFSPYLAGDPGVDVNDMTWGTEVEFTFDQSGKDYFDFNTNLNADSSSNGGVHLHIPVRLSATEGVAGSPLEGCQDDNGEIVWPLECRKGDCVTTPQSPTDDDGNGAQLSSQLSCQAGPTTSYLLEFCPGGASPL